MGHICQTIWTFVTHVQLVSRCSVGLQVVIRGSAPEAASQFVMLALNQVLLQREQKSAEESHRFHSIFLSLSPSPSGGRGLSRCHSWSGWASRRLHPAAAQKKKKQKEANTARGRAWQMAAFLSTGTDLFVIDDAELFVVCFDAGKLHHQVHEVGAALLTLRRHTGKSGQKFRRKHKHLED